MANVKITELTALTDPASTDVLPIVDVVADVTKKISIADLLENAGSGTAAAPGIAFDGDSNTGIYRPGADQVAFATNGTGRLFIDSAGNVGIGTSSPDATLKVQPVSSDIPQSAFGIRQNNAADTTQTTLDVEIDPVNSTARILSNATSSPRIGLYTSNQLALYIDESQLVGIGTSSPAYQLQLGTDSAGKPSTNTWTIVSDERIKEDIQLADLDICYEAIKNIPLKRFKWKDEVYTEKQVPDRHKLGWIAQDVESVFPKAVRIHEFKYNQVFKETVIPAVEEKLNEDGNVITPAQPERIEKGELISEDVIEDCRDLNADQLYAAMYGAVQKLIAKVEALESELLALKSA